MVTHGILMVFPLAWTGVPLRLMWEVIFVSFICVIAILSIFIGNLFYYAIYCCFYNSYFGLFLQILTLMCQEILRLMWEVLMVGHGILRVFQVSWTGV